MRCTFGSSVGIGYDVHRLVQGRPLILGGVSIVYEKGLLGHSDADVLVHAICDAYRWEQPVWAISDTIFRTRIRNLKIYPV